MGWLSVLFRLPGLLSGLFLCCIATAGLRPAGTLLLVLLSRFTDLLSLRKKLPLTMANSNAAAFPLLIPKQEPR